MTKFDEPGPCPDAQTLTAFMEGRLDGDAWRAAADHVRQCDDCLFVIGGTFAFERETAPRSLPAWLLVAAGFVIVVAAIIGLVSIHRSDSLRRMSAAVQKSGMRTFEGRVVEIAYARYSATRSTEHVDPALTAAAVSVLRQVNKPVSAPEWHLQGIAHLVMGHTSEAVVALAEAAQLDPNSAVYRSDLAAARIADGTERGDAAELRQAVVDADQALRMKRLAEALFNRALALERLGDAANASMTYREYIVSDPQSRWSEEARWRIARLAQQPR